jgi:hypothetical protein
MDKVLFAETTVEEEADDEVDGAVVDVEVVETEEDVGGVNDVVVVGVVAACLVRRTAAATMMMITTITAATVCVVLTADFLRDNVRILSSFHG